MPSQTELIGSHPIAPNIFDHWLECTDINPVVNRSHRSLVGKIPSDEDRLTDWLAQKIIDHHYDSAKVERLKQKYREIGFPRYAEQNRRIPNADKTRKGNATEIVLIEYIESCQPNRNLFKIFKFRYNTNVDQSMKGDDALIVDIVSDQLGQKDLKIYLGEAKFRSKPDNDVLVDLSNSLGRDKLPLSYSFLVDELYKDPVTEPLARLLDGFILDEIKARGNMKYAGLLLSNKRTLNFVEKYFQCDNPAMVLISAGLDNPGELISEAYRKAQDLLKRPDLL